MYAGTLTVGKNNPFTCFLVPALYPPLNISGSHPWAVLIKIYNLGLQRIKITFVGIGLVVKHYINLFIDP